MSDTINKSTICPIFTLDNVLPSVSTKLKLEKSFINLYEVNKSSLEIGAKIEINSRISIAKEF